jgi:asparagine synthase (glutamine-hydrolysing)
MATPHATACVERPFGYGGHCFAAFEKGGVEAAVKRFVGMFSFGLWDRQDLTLYLVRDRLGEKPLYYGWMGKTFLFGSELKALRVHPDFRGEIDRNVLALFLRHNYVPAPYSIYRGICKLLPGTILKISPGSTAGNRCQDPVPYWSAREVAENGAVHPFEGTESEAIQHLETLLRKAIRHQMVADVPLGAFLSGGVDSSTVVAIMQAQSVRSVKTFTIGFHEHTHDEAVHATAVARHLGTDHTELYVSPEDALAVIPKLSSIYDEPFSDSSQIPTFLISELTRKYVTVSLSGDAGDELFGGYPRYFFGRTIWKKTGWIPLNARKKLSSMIMNISPQTWEAFFSRIDPLLPKTKRKRFYGDKITKLAEILCFGKPEELYKSLVSHWETPDMVILGAREPMTMLSDRRKWADMKYFILIMMFLDLITYLPDDILVKVDRAAMANSLETRVPFLDHRVVEFAWQLPLSMKIRNGQGKWILRQVLKRYVPTELIERPKMGFRVPIDSWLRGALRDWAENLLGEARLKNEGFFHLELIREKWNEHVAGTRNWHYCLWDVLMFQEWLETQN